MPTKKRKILGICAYCGGIGDVTDDHIPPQSMFPAGFGSPYVPSCFSCNNGASADDEHFRTLLGIRKDVETNPVVEEILPAILRGLIRHKKQGTSPFVPRKERYIPTFSSYGGWNGYELRLEPDDPVIRRVVARITRGLYFREFGTRLPHTHAVYMYSLNNYGADPVVTNGVKSLRDFARMGRSVVVHPDVFGYALNRASGANGEIVVWTMLFYGRIPFMSHCLARNSYSHISEQLI